MAKSRGPHPLATQICGAIGVDPNSVVRLVFTADSRNGRVEQVELTMLPSKAEVGLITRRYALVELGDEPAAGAEALAPADELVDLPSGSRVMCGPDFDDKEGE